MENNENVFCHYDLNLILNNENYDPYVCYISCTPIEILGVINIEESKKFANHLNKYKEILEMFGEVKYHFSFVYDVSQEEQLQYLKSKEEKIIDVLKKRKRKYNNKILLIADVLEEELLPTVDLTKVITTGDAEFLYIESLIKKVS